MFAKVFSQIFDSSIANNYTTRHVFIDMLVLADSSGVVDMTHEAIARRTNVPIEMVRKAIAELEAPDLESRSHQDEGRRLVPIDSNRSWGWQIVNYQHYRALQDEEARRAYFRDKKREYRIEKRAQKRKAQALNAVQDTFGQSKTVLESPKKSTASTEEEEEGEGNSKVNLNCDEKERSGKESGSKPGKPVSPTSPKKGKTKRPKVDVTSDEVFVAELKRHYPDIDIDREFRKMRAWLLTPKGRGKVLTRQRVINWLNRVDTPVSLGFEGNSQGHSKSEFEKAKAALPGLTREEWDNGSRRIDDYWKSNANNR